MMNKSRLYRCRAWY